MSAKQDGEGRKRRPQRPSASGSAEAPGEGTSPFGPTSDVRARRASASRLAASRAAQARASADGAPGLGEAPLVVPFTWAGLAGVGGASVAVSTISGTLSSAFQWVYPPWLPLVLSLVLVVLGDLSVGRHRPARERFSPMRPVLWLLNACLVFSTAVGGTRLMVPSGAASAGAVPSSVVPDGVGRQGSESAPAPVPVAPAAAALDADRAEGGASGADLSRARLPISEPSAPPASVGELRGVRARSVDERASESASARAEVPALVVPAPRAAATRPKTSRTDSGAAAPRTTNADAGPAEAPGFQRLGDMSLF